MIGVVVLVVFATSMAAGCDGALTEDRRQVEIIEANPSELGLQLTVASCNGEPAITDINEGSGEVRITVEATTRLWGDTDGCADMIEAPLEDPIRDRVVIDGATGQVVEVPRG